MKYDKSMRRILGTIEEFSLSNRVQLRSYQSEVAHAFWNMMRGDGGRSMAVMLPRQSGKNVLQAQIEAYLLLVCHLSTDAEIIKIAPTLKPQAMISIRRLESVLRTNVIARKLGWKKEQGTAIRVGGARISFYSGEPQANIVGATASLLLSIDEAQHIDVDHFNTQIAPMAAAKNSARIFWGTAWTADTLLARQLRLAEKQQEGEQPMLQRAFRADAARVGAEVPGYMAFVDSQVAQLGRDHPAVRTQYFSEEIAAAGGLFSGPVLEQVQGEHPWQEGPRSDTPYAFLIDVGGEGSGDPMRLQEEHDATALVIVAVEPARGELPRYRVVHLCSWSGAGVPRLKEELLALERRWKPRVVVVDATGLGQGLAAELELVLRARLRRFTFTASSKSKAGWVFSTLVAGGRFLLPRSGGGDGNDLVGRLREQMLRCTKDVGAGSDNPLRWSVPDGARADDGTLLHDDLLTAAALCTQLDLEAWPARAETLVIPARDPLREMDGWKVSKR